jgi:hypothetical protein
MKLACPQVLGSLVLALVVLVIVLIPAWLLLFPK